MFVAYVVYNLDDGHDLNMIGCSDTTQGAIDMLNKRLSEEEDEIYGEWHPELKDASDYTTDDNRIYGYQQIPFVEDKR